MTVAGSTTMLLGIESSCDETAAALVWMSERYLIERLGRGDRRVKPAALVDTIVNLWSRVLYGGPGA